MIKTPKVLRKATIKSRNNSRSMAILSAGYLVGCVLGTILPQDDFSGFYADYICQLTRMKSCGTQFSLLFLPQIGFFFAVLLLGVCAVGIPLMPLLFLGKGFSFGYLIGAAFHELSFKGMLIIWSGFWIPEVFSLLLLLHLSSTAWAVSGTITKCCRGISVFGMNAQVQNLLTCGWKTGTVLILSSLVQMMLFVIFRL